MIPEKKDIDANLKLKEDPASLEDLHSFHFSNNPEDVFSEVKSLEDRYNYVIFKTKEKIEQKRLQIQQKGALDYQNAVQLKRSEITNKLDQYYQLVKQKMQELDMKEQKILQEIGNFTSKNEKKIIEEILAQLGYDF
jgi:chemotaxis regulatin CheY-phosphate phosphatase CheZ